MTTTMDSPMNLQNAIQSPLQEQAQTNLTPNHVSSLAPPTVPEHTATPHPFPAGGDDIAAKAHAERKRELTALGKTHGSIPNVPIFTQWDNRQDCCNSAVHRSIMAGICGNRNDGAFSIVLSSLYKDDEDRGDVIIYTGAGGRKRWTDTYPPKRLRFGPQVYDQSWEDSPNRALIISSLTGDPVRVIRSWKCSSEYAPVKGYRYDGLYIVTKVWTAIGLNKKKICRCRLERLPDQPPIPVRPITFSTSKRRRGRGLVDHFGCGPSPSTNPCDTSDQTNSGVGLNHHDSFPRRSAGSTGGVSEGWLNLQQQPAISETSAGIESNMDIDMTHATPQNSNPQGGVSVKPGALARYRWDTKTNRLVRLSAPSPTREKSYTTDGEEEEECRAEDDATLVSSEDDCAGVERMETEFFSDGGSIPPSVTPDELHTTSSDSVL